MKFFGKEPEVPNTISDEQMTDIQRRAQWAHRNEDPVGKKAVEHRVSSIEQKQKRHLS